MMGLERTIMITAGFRGIHVIQSAFGNSPRLVYDLPEHSHRIVVTHILKVDVIHLPGFENDKRLG